MASVLAEITVGGGEVHGLSWADSSQPLRVPLSLSAEAVGVLYGVRLLYTTARHGRGCSVFTVRC